MSQAPFNTQFNIPCPSLEIYQNPNGEFCTYQQNYFQNVAFYSQNQLFSYAYPAPYGQFPQQFPPSLSLPTNLYPPGTFQATPIHELKPSSIPQVCSYPTNVE